MGGIAYIEIVITQCVGVGIGYEWTGWRTFTIHIPFLALQINFARCGRWLDSGIILKGKGDNG